MAEMKHYKCDRQNLKDFVYDSLELNESLALSFQKSSALFARIVETELWRGRSKDEFTSFYHLLMQYHGWVAGEIVPSVGDYPSTVSANTNGNNCCDRMRQAFSELFNTMNSFTQESEVYKQLKEISE